MSSTKSSTGFVSDQDLTEREFIEKYQHITTLTEGYLKARYRWLTLRPGGDTQKAMNEMHDAYSKTEAYQIYNANRQTR